MKDVIDLALSELNVLVPESRAAQGKLAVFHRQYEKRKVHIPLPPRTLHKMREGTRTYLDLQNGLADVEARVEPFAMADAARLDVGAEDPGLARMSVGTALAAAVTLYDNYLAMLPLLANRHFRRLVNNPDLGYGIGKDELWNLVSRLNSAESRKRLLHLVGRWNAGAGSEAGRASADLLRVDEAITSSTTYALTQDATLDRRLPTDIRIRRERVLDGLARAGDDALYVVSEGFGNAIGKVELRKGKLWQREDVLAHLHRVLRPLDLLLEKTPFRLTDLLIPGHFGHVAIWMGKPGELKRLGVWKQDAMQAERFQHCREEIEEGRGVLEALRSGVELNPLRVFANVDDLAVLRPMRMKRKEKVESLVRGFQQVGKEYDFNFDVETTGTIVCSELPYHVYPGVEWTTAEQMGRFTISPDQVALEALEGNADFGLVAFYHDGALVPPKDAMQTFRTLLADD